MESPPAERFRPTDILKLHWILRNKENWRVRTMSELNSKVSQHILSLLEGERIRVILRDTTVVEGVVVRVSPEKLTLGNRTVPLDQIATYYVLKGD
jgi:hypothetical protein